MDPLESSKEAGLRYVTDAEPGIRRRRAGRGFIYVLTDGSRLTDTAKAEWIRSLAIPPAWTDVWICRSRLGHLQATGRDSRGRKQYRYHPRWRAERDSAKYGRMISFGRALPHIRRRVDRDLRRSGLPRERVLAAVVRLLEKTGLRVGNEEYARDNESFGLTTLRDRHARIGSPRIRFRFRGKGGKTREVEISDARLARIVGRCQDLPGQELFQFKGADGERQTISSDDVNAYLRTITGRDITAKDFRTWAGTMLAAKALAEIGPAQSATQGRRNVVRAVEQVATWLRNTPAVSRRAYVHPDVIDAYRQGDVVRRARDGDERRAPLPDLGPYEVEVLALLRRHLTSRSAGSRSDQAASTRRRARR